jgi:hypothetical protein
MLAGQLTCLYAALLDLDHEIARGNAIATNRCLTASRLAVQGARDCVLSRSPISVSCLNFSNSGQRFWPVA